MADEKKTPAKKDPSADSEGNKLVRMINKNDPNQELWVHPTCVQSHVKAGWKEA